MVFDALTLGCEGEAVEALVLDVSDAFWTLPLRTRERRYFVGKLRGHFFCYLRLAQGSRGALLAWGRFIALMGRLAQAVVGTRAARLQIFVDDPILVVAGKFVERQEMIGLFIFVLRWNANSSWSNQWNSPVDTTSNDPVDWIGTSLQFGSNGILATIKQEKRSELQKLIASTLRRNVVSSKFLQSLAGKLSDGARLLTTWRPFLCDLWVARHRERSVGAFGRSKFATLCCDSRHSKSASRIVITTDASPFGFGGVLQINDVTCSHFA